MSLSSLDDPNCDTDRHKAPVRIENFVKEKRKTVITKCDRCDSIIEVKYKPVIVTKELERGWAPLD